MTVANKETPAQRIKRLKAEKAEAARQLELTTESTLFTEGLDEGEKFEGGQAVVVPEVTKAEEPVAPIVEAPVVVQDSESEPATPVVEPTTSEVVTPPVVEPTEPATTELVVEDAEELVTAEQESIQQSAQIDTDDYIKEVENVPTASELNPHESNVFQRLSRAANSSNPSTDSYAALVESMISQQCSNSGVKNLDLTTFGLRAQALNFPNLTVLTYGRHKFLGVPFTEEEENIIIHRLGLYVAKSPKQRLVISATQEVKDERGMLLYSMLFSEEIVQRFVEMFDYEVRANYNEADLSKLVIVVDK